MEIGDGMSMITFHGSPRSTTEVLSATTSEDAVATIFASTDASIAVGGHTHVQLLRTTERMVLVNPGSVGLGGIGSGTPDLSPSEPATGAEFAVLDVEGSHSSVAFHHIDLDIPTMLDSASATEMPHFDWWASLWQE